MSRNTKITKNTDGEECNCGECHKYDKCQQSKACTNSQRPVSTITRGCISTSNSK